MFYIMSKISQLDNLINEYKSDPKYLKILQNINEIVRIKEELMKFNDNECANLEPLNFNFTYNINEEKKTKLLQQYPDFSNFVDDKYLIILDNIGDLKAIKQELCKIKGCDHETGIMGTEPIFDDCALQTDGVPKKGGKRKSRSKKRPITNKKIKKNKRTKKK